MAAADPLTARAVWRAAPALVALVVVLAGCTPLEGAGDVAGVGDPDRLTVAREIDGDSFVASDGVEYRVGMVNTPELSECGGHETADRTYELLADGFSAEPYADDPHGRQVARIAVDGGDLGVILAAEGLADDRYVDRHRREHPGYAAELDEAFAEARRDQSGLWTSCWAGAAGG